MKPEDMLVKQRKDKRDFFIREGMNPYPTKFEKKDNVSDIIKLYKTKIRKGEKTRKNVSLAGRIMSLRMMGQVCFGDIQDESGRMQFYVKSEETGKKYELFKKFDIGDIIGLRGVIFKTHRGELSIWVKDFELLTKNVRPLPEKWHGLRDTELRYRQRYVDLIMNPDVKKVFLQRSKIIETMREFLVRKEFVEVETPILQPIYGGTNAKPFESKLNALDMKVYMRISNELYLKRLLVGGYEKVFEFSVDFRNEGIDRTHNPEFLQMETMCAYADYKNSMALTKEMINYIVKKVCGNREAYDSNSTSANKKMKKVNKKKRAKKREGGGLKITYQGAVINFKKPWKKMSMAEGIKKYTGLDVMIDFSELKKKAVGVGVDTADCKNWGQIVEKIFEERVEKNLINPTIIYDYPADTSPLAKKKIENPRFVERFEVYINGWEIINSYSELNDPQVLIENWEKQEALGKKGIEETQVMDKDFVRALEYGMPPASGIGVGIDRLVMLLTDSASIRDVMFFPFMKPKQN